LPACVREVHVRGDGEFIGWESVKACLDKGFFFTFGNKRCDPPFPDDGWYRHGQYEYNECVYQPLGWEQPCRFVVMRIREEQRGEPLNFCSSPVVADGRLYLRLQRHIACYDLNQASEVAAP
jgi:hypothetical protein